MAVLVEGSCGTLLINAYVFFEVLNEIFLHAENRLVCDDGRECLVCCGVVKEPFIRCRQCRPAVDICLEVCFLF